VLGIVLLILAFTPIYRVMDVSVEAPHREVSVEVAGVTQEMALWGTVTTVLLAWVLSRLVPASKVRSAAEFLGRRLVAIPLAWFASGLAALSAALAALVGTLLYRGQFTNVDEIASTLHARYLAEGMLGGPTAGLGEHWLIPNTLEVPAGWVSQFPPTHLLALAGVERLGTPGLLGPLCLGVLVGLVALSLPRLLPGRQATARAAALAVALCPFLLFGGGGAMSHVSASMLAAAVLYSALRARDGGAGWALLTGAAGGLLFADRPLVGLVLGAVLSIGVWVSATAARAADGLRWLGARLALAVAGGAPFAVLLAAYNQKVFGDPLTFGYLAAFGERHRLGFHMDPWGYPYGLREAFAFTSSDVLAAGVQMLETPFPITAWIGLALLVGLTGLSGLGLLLAWAFLPVVANAYYWFHDVRMLTEAAPAWVALGVIGAVELARTREGETSRLASVGRDVAAWAALVGVAFALAWGFGARWNSYRWTEGTLARITAPTPPTEPAVVFVHASWNERLSSRLQAAGGMRQDSVISLLRRNSNCALHTYALAREARAQGVDVPLPPIDLEQVPGTPADIERPAFAEGATIRVRRGEAFSPTCRREVEADRFGAVALAPLVWQGDLPGIETGRPLFVRDMGPERNLALLRRYPERAVYLFTPTRDGAPPQLLPYAEGVRLLWGGDLEDLR